MSDDSRLHELRAEVGRVAATPLSRLIAADPARAGDFALKVGPIYASFARQGYDRDALAWLFRAAEAAGSRERLQALFDGQTVNVTEGRPALHTALRGDFSHAPIAHDAHREALKARAQMRAVVGALSAS